MKYNHLKKYISLRKKQIVVRDETKIEESSVNHKKLKLKEKNNNTMSVLLCRELPL